MVEDLHFQCRGHGIHRWWRNKDPTCLGAAEPSQGNYRACALGPRAHAPQQAHAPERRPSAAQKGSLGGPRGARGRQSPPASLTEYISYGGVPHLTLRTSAPVLLPVPCCPSGKGKKPLAPSAGAGPRLSHLPYSQLYPRGLQPSTWLPKSSVMNK